jgi:hypothetical protein
VARDLLGKVARVFFCAFKGSEFDRNPKRWRLVADITNDATACCDLVTHPPPEQLLSLNRFTARQLSAPALFN